MKDESKQTDPQQISNLYKFEGNQSHSHNQLHLKYDQSQNKVKEQIGQKQQINIAMVSDFYYPFVGGVEIHIKQLATQLSKHNKIGKIIVITHKHDHHDGLKFTGVKNYHGFPVYYLNIHYNKQYMITYPTFIFNFKAASRILKWQKIDIVHCHQSGSPLALQFIFFARLLGLRVILTEHSLYGFRSLSDIHFNYATGIFMRMCDYIIGVSKTTRNNIILRADADKSKVIVIPNGVANVSHIANKNLSSNAVNTQNGKRIIRIISVGRMTFRRGTDLLIQILPQLCKQNDDIQIWIVGDGVKRKVVQKIVEDHQLHRKVKLLGIISDHDKLLQKMAECDIFLNTPLTQSFGIALAQAAMLGLFCVSTNVGGVDQAIPSQKLYTATVQPSSLLMKLTQVVNLIRKQQLSKTKIMSKHKIVNTQYKYEWEDVGKRTVQLYQHVMKQKTKSGTKYFISAFKSGALLQIFFALIGIILTICHLLPFMH